MKAKDLIKALKNLDPESDVKIVIKQDNKVYGLALDIKYGTGSMEEIENIKDGEYSNILNTWVNNRYRGSITVHLPDGARITRLPEHLKMV